jgi:hypothetical protein
MLPRGTPSASCACTKIPIPDASLEMALHLRQVEVRSAAPPQQLGSVVEEEETEIEQRSRNGPSLERDVALRQMQPRGRTIKVAVAVQR